MKLKSYLIGVGIGLIVAALAMGVATNSNEKPVSEASPKENKTMYTMSPEPSVVLSKAPSVAPSKEPGPEPSLEPSEEPSPEPSKQPSETPSLTPSETPSLTPSEAPSLAPSEAPSVAPSKEPAVVVSDESVTIRVESGDNSYDICKKLCEAGLVENALDYDTYLCQKHYDNKIKSGSYTIPKGSDAEAIAVILVNK